MKKYSTILFDLDGTLLDTSEGIIKSIDYTIKVCGFKTLLPEEKKSFIGPPINQSLKATYNLTDEEAFKAAHIFRDVYRNMFLYEAHVYEEIPELLKEFREIACCKTGVATYKVNDYAQRLLEHFGISQLCDYVLGSDGKKQTKADIIRICLKELSCEDMSRAVLIGDTVHDAKGAYECGIDFIGVTYGFGFRTVKDALDSGAVAGVKSVDELRELLI